MTALLRYEAARSALAECRTIDEVKTLHDKAEAVRAYARMANDVQLEIDAAEIRLRAERRLGILLAEEKTAGRLTRGQPKKNCTDEEQYSRIKLEDVGIDRKLSARAQKAGGIAERAFDLMIDNMRRRMAEGRGRVSLDIIDQVDKKERRARREAELAQKQQALPTKKYGVILADPEWRFEVYSRDTGMDRAADNHYPTSETDAICARPVADIAADDCALFLWATVPMLPDALRVMTAWGFTYKSHFIWGKDRPGTGYWNRNCHELLLVGTRGKIPAPAPGTQFESLIDAAVGEHSQKPDFQYDIVERYFPNLPKIELNARRAREGWDAWGYEAPDSVCAENAQSDSNPICDEPFDADTGEIAEAPAPAAPVNPEPKPEDDLSIPPFLLRVPKGEAVA